MTDRLRIVHLEDDWKDATLVRETLDQEGLLGELVHVETAEAFVKALESEPDLVLSDYGIPGFDGLSALAILRQLSPETPFILVSGTLGEEAAIESLRSGATDYVLKTRLSRLAPAVHRALDEARERKTRRSAEHMLERERKFLLAMLDSLETGVMACDQNGVLTLFNRATRVLHGLPEDPPPPDQWTAHYQLLQPDGKTPLATAEMPLHRALMGERLRQTEMAIRHADGTVRSVVVSGQPIVDDSGARLGAVVAMQDVTEHRQLERQFRQAQKMEAMGRLAAGVAHDFNNLLTVIGGYCQLATARIGANEPAARDLAEIAQAGERAAKLTRQLLAFSRQQVLEPRILDLNLVIAEMEKMLQRLIGADIGLASRGGSGLGAIRADAGQMEQVLMNLIVNARDAMPDGGTIVIETENVEVGRDTSRDSGIPPGPYVVLTVRDTGSGMDAETASRIFEPFFTTKEAGRGTGLGLSTVHGIVTQSGGHIALQTEPGMGTTFRIHFPRVDGVSEVARPAAVESVQTGGSETVLVVDDDSSLRALVGEILRIHGYTVIEAANGEAALTLLRRRGNAIGVLVTDVVMPGMTGRALAEEVERIHPGLPTLFMSGYVGDQIDALGTILRERAGFVQKPFTPDALLAKLREVLEGPADKAA